MPPKKKKRRGQYTACYSSLLLCDGENEDAFTEHVAADLDPEQPPDPEKAAAQLAIAQAIINAIRGSGGTSVHLLPHDSVQDSPASGDGYDRYDGHDEYVDHSAGNDDGADSLALGARTRRTAAKADDSDYGSDSSGEELRLPINWNDGATGPTGRHSQDTNSRFQTWSKRVPAIFDCLYGEDPVGRVPTTPTSEGFTCCPCPPDEHTVKLIVDVYDIAPCHPMMLHSCKAHVVDNIMRAQLFPATPSRPRVAFSIKFIRLYQSLFNVAGISATNMALVIQHLMRGGLNFQRQRTTHSVSDQLRRQLKSALTWLTVIERYCDKLALEGSVCVSAPRPPINDDDLDLQLCHLADSCPACFRPFQTGSSSVPGYPDAPQVIICIDGNFTQKRQGGRDSVPHQPFPPRRFLSRRQVTTVAELMSRTPGTDPSDSNCISKIRAASANAAKAQSDPCDINGVMGACCRHDIPLVMCDIDTPGERHHYAIALIRAVTKAVGPNLQHLGIAYDIGCRFQPSAKVASVLGSDLKVTWVVPVFHVYGHVYSCQVRFNPRNTPGFGMTDGEGMERVWASMASLITSTRGMSAGDRRFALEERCQFIATERRVNLIDIIDAKLKRLDSVKAKARLVLQEFKQDSIPEWYKESRRQQQQQTQEQLASTGTIQPATQLRPRHSRLAPPFDEIDLETVRAVKTLSLRRRKQLDRHELPAEDVLVPDSSPTGVFARSLLRTLAEVQLLSALMYVRPATVRKGYKATIRFRQGITAAKASAAKIMAKLNTAMMDKYLAEGGDLPHPLTVKTLYTDATFQVIENWAKAFDPTTKSLPWWAKPSTATAMDAYEELCRYREESARLAFERKSANEWVDARIEELRNLSKRRPEPEAEARSPGSHASDASGGPPSASPLTASSRATASDQTTSSSQARHSADARADSPQAPGGSLWSFSVMEDALEGISNLKTHWSRAEDLADVLLPTSDASLTAGDDIVSKPAAIIDDAEESDDDDADL
ncbi:hypothetical protein OC842_000784 [Tilletia horrida]|uniref:CxC1-like cysteine cluster associated with KDZ transposases domain-containing protein n=1 Tax=Tilletia horrida TaxID=155126 RepID=A0AAN6GGU3_9BASI|nr:hypothetical protein OC842_000784 [Tilletia horrida]